MRSSILSALLVLFGVVVLVAGCDEQPDAVPITTSTGTAVLDEKPKPTSLDSIDDESDIDIDVPGNCQVQNLTKPVALESIGQSEKLDEAVDRLTKPMDDVVEEEKSLAESEKVKFVLAPLPDDDAQEMVDTEDGEDGSQIDEATPYDSPLDAPRGQTTAETGDALVEQDDLQQNLDVEGKTAGQLAMREIDATKRLPKRPVVYNKPQLIAGKTLQVNNRYITADQVLAGVHRQLSEIPRGLGVQQFATIAQGIIGPEIGYQIQQSLVYTEAEKYLDDGIKARVKQEMNDMLREMIADSGGSKEQLRRKCLSEGMTLEEVLDAHRRGLTVTMYMQSKFYPAISVTRRMLWKHYQKNKSQYVTEKKVQMQIIAAPFDKFLPRGVTNPTVAEKALARKGAKNSITAAMNELKNGKDFTTVAKMYSRGIRASGGGVWPLMPRGSSVYTKVEDAAFKLPYSRYSKIIEEPKVGYFIVKAMRVHPGKTISFEDAQEKIAENIKYAQFMKLRGDYFKKLQENATIGEMEPFVKFTIDQAVERYWQ